MKSVQEIAGLTIGGFDNTAKSDRNRVFSEYIKKALPSREVTDVKVIASPASLNSVAASGMIDGKKYFFKVHIESGSKVEEEYRQAELLAEAGWPVYEPSFKGDNPDFPLLAYLWTDSPTLFDRLDSTYKSEKSTLSTDELKSLEDMNIAIGQAEIRKLKEASSQEAATAPIQMFFARRFEPGGRLDDWYKPDTVFHLPDFNGGILELEWKLIKDAKWVVNRQSYPQTLASIIKAARDVLAYSGEDKAWVTTSHGDDHAGNIFLAESQALVFDPAAASDVNPVVLSDVKALAHNCFLPMAGMYYAPKIPYQYAYDSHSNVIKVEANFSKSPAFEIQKTIAGQIVDLRINPALNLIKEKGTDMRAEYERFRTALAGCALLTINIAELLKQEDNRGIGLLPMAVMLYELKGLEPLEKLEKI